MGLTSKIKRLFSKQKYSDRFDMKTEKVEYMGGLPVLFNCGHTMPAHGKISFWNCIFEEDFSGETEIEAMCADCALKHLQKHAIRCALCGRVIIPGSAVALYDKCNKYINKQAATFVDDCVIGCLYADCCPSGGFFAGHWTEKGFEPLFESGLSMVGEAFASGDSILIQGDQIKRIKKQ
jgi:hypothetical protein